MGTRLEKHSLSRFYEHQFTFLSHRLKVWIPGLWRLLRSAWTCWSGRLPLANSTIQGVNLERSSSSKSFELCSAGWCYLMRSLQIKTRKTGWRVIRDIRGRLNVEASNVLFIAWDGALAYMTYTFRVNVQRQPECKNTAMKHRYEHSIFRYTFSLEANSVQQELQTMMWRMLTSSDWPIRTWDPELNKVYIFTKCSTFCYSHSQRWPCCMLCSLSSQVQVDEPW